MTVKFVRLRKRTEEERKVAHRAHSRVSRALADGEIVKPRLCQRCHLPPKTRVEAHHKDYSKPLEVLWVCPPCHKFLDFEERKALGIVEGEVPAPPVGKPPRAPSGNETPVCHFRMPEEMIDEVDTIAQLANRTRSDVIKACLKAALPFVRSKVESQLKAQEATNEDR